MSKIDPNPSRNPVSGPAPLLAARWPLIRDYMSAISGSAGRLIFSLLYFIALANTLSIADFGLFATASAAGVMLSRILALGFISTVYRTATVRPRLIGTFTAGFLWLGLWSLPLLALASWAVFVMFFEGDMPVSSFALIVAAEALLWRPLELVIIVNNGMGRFGRASVLVILGTVFRAAAAILFALAATRNLHHWALFYLAANAAACIVGFIAFYPRQRLRFRPQLYWRRLPDAIYVAAAEVLFYLQMEFDKLLVLSLGGARLAGLYAIVMRLVDLTAIPIRTFTMMLVQKLMRTPHLLSRLTVKAGLEAGIFLVSTAALGALALVLHFFPTALGSNVAEAAPLVALALLVPAFRNLTEYQAELLFARGQTFVRACNLAVLAAVKAVLLWILLSRFGDAADLLIWLNVAFALLYLASAGLTYGALRLPARRI